MHIHFNFRNYGLLLAASVMICKAGTLQAQKGNWLLFQPNAASLNASLKSTGGSWGTSYPKPQINGKAVSGYTAMNSAVDINGKLIFYALCSMDSTYVFDP